VTDPKPEISVLLPDEATVAARRDALTAAARAGVPPVRRRPGWLRGYRPVVAATAFAIVLVALGFFAFEKDDAPTVHPAFADAAVRVAEANPRLLVTASGWSVKHAYGFEVDSGSMIFGDGTHHLSFDWYPARYYRSYLLDRRKVSAFERSTILGHRATTVRYHRSVAGEPGLDYETLFSPWGSVAVGIRGIFSSKREYQTILSSLRRVDVDTWLKAMPPEVVQPAALDATIKRMLRGVPLPPSFDSSTLPNPSLITDRYRLGTAVTGAVTCGWLEDWVAAARSNDLSAAREAADGLGSARHWPVLLAMVHEKGWTGERLPVHGNGWASTILTAAREIGRGRLSQADGIYMRTRDGRYFEEGPGWSVHFGCKAHYRRQLKPPKSLSEIGSNGPVVTLSR
jgi:hypothetical protein